jgi:hypothetical protein
VKKLIVQSAIKYEDNLILTGRRHSDVIAAAALIGRYTRSHNSVQGFVDNEDTFYTRAEAKELCLLNGQITSEHKGELYSEDLWQGRVEE